MSFILFIKQKGGGSGQIAFAYQLPSQVKYTVGNRGDVGQSQRGQRIKSWEITG